MHVWAGEENSMGMLYVVFLVLYFYFTQYSDLLHMYKSASGIWSEDKYRPLITSIINLVLDIILVKYFGLLGIIFATWISMAAVGIPWLISNIFHHVFVGFSMSDYVKKMLLYVLSTILACLVSYGICLLLKQGIYLYLQSNVQKDMSKSAKLGQGFMLIFSLIFVLGIYVVNLVYYMNLNDFMTFAIFISFFFSGIMAVLAIACGYFKCNTSEWTILLDKYEYREDF